MRMKRTAEDLVIVYLQGRRPRDMLLEPATQTYCQERSPGETPDLPEGRRPRAIQKTKGGKRVIWVDT